MRIGDLPRWKTVCEIGIEFFVKIKLIKIIFLHSSLFYFLQLTKPEKTFYCAKILNNKYNLFDLNKNCKLVYYLLMNSLKLFNFH